MQMTAFNHWCIEEIIVINIHALIRFINLCLALAFSHLHMCGNVGHGCCNKSKVKIYIHYSHSAKLHILSKEDSIQ